MVGVDGAVVCVVLSAPAPPIKSTRLEPTHSPPPEIQHTTTTSAGGFLNKPLDGDGNTPLILAVTCGAYRIVDWIVAQPGVELDARNR